MTERTVMTRRRAIAIIAGGVGALVTGPARAAQLREWRGTALGADARIVLAHPDRRHVDETLGAVCLEIERLENIFSLYRSNSAVSRLNAAGGLDPAPLELIELTHRALWYTSVTGGAFDVTVQPLWELYAGHFRRHPADTAGPAIDSITAVRRLIGPEKVRIDASRIQLAPGSRLTFNGIAQGYITDRVAALLRGRGWRNILIDLGETRALDAHPDGRPWRIGLPGGGEAAITDAAIATSEGTGTRFTPTTPQHHLFDPCSGTNPLRRRAVTVISPYATDADALSTALFIAPPDARQTILEHVPGAHLITT